MVTKIYMKTDSNIYILPSQMLSCMLVKYRSPIVFLALQQVLLSRENILQGMLNLIGWRNFVANAIPTYEYRKTEKGAKMNRDILEGKWKQLRGQVRQQWGELTDNDLDQVSGRFDRLAGLIQEKYGYSRDEAENMLDNFLNTLPGDPTIPPPPPKPR